MNATRQTVAGTYRLNSSELIGLREITAGLDYPHSPVVPVLPREFWPKDDREQESDSYGPGKSLHAMGDRFNRPTQEPLRPLADILREEFGYVPATFEADVE